VWPSWTHPTANVGPSLVPATIGTAKLCVAVGQSHGDLIYGSAVTIWPAIQRPRGGKHDLVRDIYPYRSNYQS